MVDRVDRFLSPDGAQVALLQHGHRDPYYVSPPLFTRVVITPAVDESARSQVVFSAWATRENPSVAWADSHTLLLTVDDPFGFYRCEPPSGDVRVVYQLAPSMRPDQYRAELDHQSARWTNGRREQAWRAYQAFIADLPNHPGPDGQCLKQEPR